MRLLIVIPLAMLAGCGENAQYVMDTYRGIDPLQYEADGQSWRIFDKPSEGKMMITPTIGRAMSSGATLGLDGSQVNKSETYVPAATAYLDEKGCGIVDRRIVFTAQAEFTYTC